MNLFNVYPLLPINIVKAQNCHVWDDKGTQYLDFYGGHAVISVGHSHPYYVEKIKNQLDKNFQPLELGYDKWTNNLYANKEFLMNCVNYLLDDNGLINIRSKEVNLPMLDKEKVVENYTTAQIITVGLPLVVLLLFGLVFTFLRKRKYSK